MTIEDSCACPAFVALLASFTKATRANRINEHARAILAVYIVHTFACHVATPWTSALAIEYMQPTIDTMFVGHDATPSNETISRETRCRARRNVGQFVGTDNPWLSHENRTTAPSTVSAPHIHAVSMLNCTKAPPINASLAPPIAPSYPPTPGPHLDEGAQ